MMPNLSNGLDRAESASAKANDELHATCVARPDHSKVATVLKVCWYILCVCIYVHLHLYIMS